MSIKENLSEIIKTAMKSGDKDRLLYARGLHAAIRKKEIDDRKDCDDAEVIKIISSISKQRQDSIDQFKQGGRMDLVAKEETELAFLTSFLPAPIDPAVLSGFIDQVIKDTQATSAKDMGKVMKGVQEMVQTQGKGHADGKTISRLVSEKLKK